MSSRSFTVELKNLSNQDLLIRLDKLVHSERKLTHVILCHINEVETRRLYADLGFDSMFKYLTRHCGYGDDSAYRRLQAARLLRKNPEVAEKLEQGTLNLTQLTQVQKCLKQESKEGVFVSPQETLNILQKIENRSNFETKKVLAVEFNQPIHTHEIVKPQRDESVRFEVTFTAEQMEILEKVKASLSHSLPEGNWADLIIYLAGKQLQKTFGKTAVTSINSNANSDFDRNSDCDGGGSGKSKSNSTPIAEIGFASNGKERSFSTPSFTAKRKRVPVRITIRRKLLQNAGHCCEYRDSNTNIRCRSKYQLQIDHIVPRARGGSDIERNLRVLCRTHNLLMAKRWGF